MQSGQDQRQGRTDRPPTATRPCAVAREASARSRRHAGQGRSWLSEPRTAVLIVVGGVLLLGGGRRLLQLWQARSLARLGEPDVTPEEIEAVARFGRSGLAELFRIFAESPSRRCATPPVAPSASSGRTMSSSPRKSRLWSAAGMPPTGRPAALSRRSRRSHHADLRPAVPDRGRARNQAGQPGMVTPDHRGEAAARRVFSLDDRFRPL